MNYGEQFSDPVSKPKYLMKPWNADHFSSFWMHPNEVVRPKSPLNFYGQIKW